MATCRVAGCEGDVHGHGMCNRHHRQWLRTGGETPLPQDKFYQIPYEQVDEIADYIEAYTLKHDQSPYLYEIADYLGRSDTWVRRRLEWADEAGIIRYERGTERGVEVLV